MGTHWKLVKMFKRKDFSVLSEDGLGEGEPNKPQHALTKCKGKNFHSKILPTLHKLFMSTSGSAFFHSHAPNSARLSHSHQRIWVTLHNRSTFRAGGNRGDYRCYEYTNIQIDK